MSIGQAFESFMEEDFESAVDSSTIASWGGGCYCVELFCDGTYRVLWSGEIGNLYDSPGLILGVPALDEDDWDGDPGMRFYANANEIMRDNFEEYSPEEFFVFG